MSYNDQLLAIREMLDDPAPEIIEEGYEHLFKLWLKNNDRPEFNRELIQDAISYPPLVSELRKRLRELRLGSSITASYLKDRFEAFATEVENHRPKHLTKLEVSANLLSPTTAIPEKSPKPIPWRIYIFLSATLIIALVGIINFIYVFPEVDRTSTIDTLGLKLVYSFPKYISVNDENFIEVSVENFSQRDFDGSITLIFDDPDSYIKPAANQNLSEKLDDIRPLSKKSREFTFLLIKRSPQNNIKYYFQVSRSDGSQYTTKEEYLLIAPLPYLRWMSRLLFTTLGTIIFGLFLEQIKRFVESQIKKVSIPPVDTSSNSR